MIRNCTITFLFGLLLMTSCKVIYFKVPEGRLGIEGDGYFYGGAAQEDITPHIGLPMAGYGPELGKISRGSLGKLYVHTTYIQDDQGNFIFLVTSDLWAFTRGMGDDITVQLKKRGNLRLNDGITPFNPGRETLIFTATHTHNSRANYASSYIYNDFNSAVGGFNKSQYIFLRDQIIRSIESAYHDREKAAVYFAQTNVPGLSRNRSLGAWLANPASIRQKFTSRISSGSPYLRSSPSCIADEADQYVAVNPELSCLVVKSITDDRLISVTGHYAIHPTALGSEALVACADVFGVAAGYVRTYFKKQTGTTTQEPKVSWMNGAEGDISSDWDSQGWAETIRIGESLAGQLIKLVETGLAPVGGGIAARLDPIYIDDQRLSNTSRPDLNSDGHIIMHTAEVPYIGVHANRGTEDGRYNPPGKPPIDECVILGNDEAKPSATNHNRQGKKIGNVLSPILENAAPKVFPIGIYDIGSLRMVTMPGEATTSLGEHLENAAIGTNTKSLYIGLANEYTSYITTPSEYKEQHYEGMSTLYGHATGAYLEEQVKNVSALPLANNYIGRYKYRPHGAKYKQKKVTQAMTERSYNTNDIRHSLGLTAAHQAKIISWNVKVKIGTDQMPQVDILQVTPTGNQAYAVNHSIMNGNYTISQLQNDRECFQVFSYVVGGGDAPLSWETMWIIPANADISKTYKMRFSLGGNTTDSTPFSIN